MHLDGTWPGSVTIRRGWSRAQARPWNDDGPAAAIRLVRGSSEFLGAASRKLLEVGSTDVYSPALYPSSTRVWDDAGFQRFRELAVMERALDQTLEEPDHPIGLVPPPDWDALAAVDRESFSGFWRMSALGLAEAMNATPRSALFQIDGDPGPIGYAIVGAQFTTSYLQRVAVVPDRGGEGLGTALIRGCLLWARARGARTMVLNVRPDNDRAAGIYQARGLHSTPGSHSRCSGSRPEHRRAAELSACHPPSPTGIASRCASVGTATSRNGWRPTLRWNGRSWSGHWGPRAAAERREQFASSVSDAAKVAHPHLARVFAVEVVPGGAYSVSEWIGGATAQDRVDAAQTFEFEEFLPNAAGLAGALAALPRCRWNHGSLDLSAIYYSVAHPAKLGAFGRPPAHRRRR